MKKLQGRQPWDRLSIAPSGSQHATLFNPWVNRRESVDWGFGLPSTQAPAAVLVND